MTLFKTIFSFLSLLFIVNSNLQSHTSFSHDTTYKIKAIETPLKVAVIGLTHDHVHWILGREKLNDIQIVGIVEPNEKLVARYQKQYGFSMDLVFKSMDALMQQVKPEAVMAFNDIYGHLEVVEFFAPKGIHIMVEKPLAVNLAHAEKMVGLAKKHKVHLMTNYETSWYGSNYKAFDIVLNEQKIGDIRKINFNTGHPGPIEIGCSKEFTDWLTDPKYNGGGALTDFGCYGANISTWFMQGETPLSISCTTQTIKPNIYPNVDDNATIILTYPKTEVVIQASWNWSHNRKDMTVYGKHGYVLCKNGKDMEVLEDEKIGPKTIEATGLTQGIHDPFAYFSKLIKGEITQEPYALSSIENNLIVMQILESAKHSEKTGKRVIWKDFFNLN